MYVFSGLTSSRDVLRESLALIVEAMDEQQHRPSICFEHGNVFATLPAEAREACVYSGCEVFSSTQTSKRSADNSK